MGNQSTSGIAEERAENDEHGKSEEISSPKELEEEKQIQIQENEVNIQEKGGKEEYRGSDDEDREARIVVETNVSNLDEGRSRSSNEEQDQLCTIKDLQEDQNVLVKEIDAHVVAHNEDELADADKAYVEGAVLETRVVKECMPREAVGTTSQLQEDLDMLVKEIDDHVVEKIEGDLVEADTASVEGAVLETRVDKDPMPQEGVGIDSELQEDQIMLKEIDVHVVEQSEDELVEADTGYDEGSLLDTRVDKACTPQEAVGTVSVLQDYQHMLVKGIDDQVVEKREYDDKASDEAPLLETRVDKDCTRQEAVVVTSVPQKDQNMLKEIDDHGLDEGDEAPIEGTLLETRVDEDCTPQEGVGTPSQPQDHDMLVKEIDDEKREDTLVEANTASFEGSSRVDNDELVKNDENPQEKQSSSFTTLNELQSISLLDEENGKDELIMNELGIDGCDHPSNVDESQPSDQEIKHEAPQEMIEDPNEGEGKAHESTDSRDFGSNIGYVGVQVELRKAPSFDFGLLFDARSEESDRTPLLFQDKAPTRSYSTCANPRFQGKYEGVEVEEKTIRMERSNSESSMVPPVNLLNKESNAGVVAKGNRDDGDEVSHRGSGKRKPRSSLFSTCICCTAAIS